MRKPKFTTWEVGGTSSPEAAVSLTPSPEPLTATPEPTDEEFDEADIAKRAKAEQRFRLGNTGRQLGNYLDYTRRKGGFTGRQFIQGGQLFIEQLYKGEMEKNNPTNAELFQDELKNLARQQVGLTSFVILSALVLTVPRRTNLRVSPWLLLERKW